MSSSYTPTGVYHTSLQLPDPGDPATAASVNNAGFKYVADNAEYLRQLTAPLLSGGNITPSGPISFKQVGNFSVPSGNIFAGGALQSANDVSAIGGSFAGNVVISGTLGVVGAITTSGTLGGQGFNQLAFTAESHTDVDQTISRNRIIYGASLPGSACTWTVDSTSEKNGDWIICVIGTISNNVAVSTSSGTIATLSTGGTHWVFGVRILGTWRAIMTGTTP